MFANDRGWTRRLEEAVRTGLTAEAAVERVRSEHRAKMGQARMRQLVYLCSWTAKRCNPACKQLYQRLQASGKPAKVINIAIAHKLLRQAWAVATQNVNFNPNIA